MILKLRPNLRMSFTTKMILAFVLVILIPTTFTSFSFYLAANSTVKQNVRESSIQIARQGADSLSFILNAGSDISDLIFSDQRIRRVVAASPRDITDLAAWKDDEEYMNSFLNNVVYSSSFVNIVYILKDDETGWGSGAFSIFKLRDYDLLELSWTSEARLKQGGLVWGWVQADRLSSGGDYTEMVLPIGRAFIDFQENKTIGYILVNLNGRTLMDKVKEMKLGRTGQFFVVSPEGQVMIAPEREPIGKMVPNLELRSRIVGDDLSEFEYTQNGIRYYGVKQMLSNGWILVGTVPIHEITDKLSALQRNVLISFGAFTVLGIAMGLMIASRVTRPIKMLTRQMKQVQKGDLTVRSEVKSGDELGLMSHQFNKMISDINQLMDQVQQEQKQKQDAELRAVIHRINPHFLFNTLGTLRWLIKYGQKDAAFEGISALIRLLEANMGRKGNFITIEEELDIIRKYLVILEMRYKRGFKLETRIDPEAAKFIIPRMLIQPLVENAIFHGIVPLDKDGVIEVEAHREGEAVKIAVKDNGIGILPDKAFLLESIGSAVKSGQTGIGLRHVHESIELHFARGSGVTLEPHEGGAVARMVLYAKPIQQGG